VKQYINSAERKREREREREGQRILSLMLEIQGAIIFLGSKSVQKAAVISCAQEKKKI